MQELIDLHGCIDPTHCATWKDTIDSFASGNAAIAVLYSNFTSNIMSSNSRISDRIGYAMVPGGNPCWAAHHRHLPPLGAKGRRRCASCAGCAVRKRPPTMMLMGTTSALQQGV